MVEINDFSVRPTTAESDETDATHSNVFFDGAAVDLRLEGISLDAQFCHEDRYLLFVSHNSPYADTLHIYLLDAQFQKIDEWTISPASESEWFILRNVKVSGENELQFSFFGDDAWILTVHRKPHLSAPKLAVFSSFWRPLRFALTPGFLELRSGQFK